MDLKTQLIRTPYLGLFIVLISISLFSYSDPAFAEFIFSIPPEIGPSSSDDGKFHFPEDVAVDGDGNIYVSDSANHRIQKFESGGNFILMFGWGVDSGANEFEICANSCQAGVEPPIEPGDGQFNNPSGIAVDSFDNIFVADLGNNRIQKFTSSGGFDSEFGGIGSGDGQFFFLTE